MTDSDWRWLIGVIVALLGGGAMGAIINTLVANYRNRVQPVGYRIEGERVFSAHDAKSTLRADLTVTHERKKYNYKNLFIVEVIVVNKGNTDRTEFPFGITLNQPEYTIIHEEHSTKDRHHELACTTSPSPANPLPALDCVLKPFNRGDAYSIKLFIVSEGTECLDVEKITLGSSVSVNFILAPSAAELMRSWMGSLSATIVDATVASSPFFKIFRR